VAPILLRIAAGMAFPGRGFLKPETIVELKKLVISVTLPSLLFYSFFNMKLEGRYLVVIVSVFTTCCLMLVAGIVIKRLMRQDNPYYPALFTGFEAGMLAYSLFIPVFGAENTQMVAIVQLGQTLFVFFILVTYMIKRGGAAISPGQLVVSFFKTPTILSVILGILVSVSGLSAVITGTVAGATILEFIRLLSTLTVPLIVLVIGYDLLCFDWSDLKKLRLPLVTAFIRLSLMVMMAILLNTFVIGRFLQLGHTFQAALYTIFILPPPFVLPFYMRGAKDEHRQMVLSTISVHIVISLLAYIVFISVAGPAGPA